MYVEAEAQREDSEQRSQVSTQGEWGTRPRLWQLQGPWGSHTAFVLYSLPVPAPTKAGGWGGWPVSQEHFWESSLLTNQKASEQ